MKSVARKRAEKISDDQRRRMLGYIARCYTGRRYEMDELVNEAWLRPSVRDTHETWKLFKAARWAMLDYMRTQEGPGSYRRGVQRRVWWHPLIVDNDGHEFRREPQVVPFDSAAFGDEMKRICRNLSREQKLVVNLRLDGVEWKAIARTIGIKFPEHAYQIWSKACAIMRMQYERSLQESN